jgi:hypothetical protein
MKIKFSKDLYSILGHYYAGEVYELSHDKEIIENWIEQGFCEIVKTRSRKAGEK